MNKWAACHAVSPIAEIFFRAQSVLAPPDRQMYLENCLQLGQRCAALTERLTARARTHTTPCTRARAHKGLHAKVTQPCAPARPCTRSFLTCAKPTVSVHRLSC